VELEDLTSGPQWGPADPRAGCGGRACNRRASLECFNTRWLQGISEGAQKIQLEWYAGCV